MLNIDKKAFPCFGTRYDSRSRACTKICKKEVRESCRVSTLKLKEGVGSDPSSLEVAFGDRIRTDLKSDWQKAAASASLGLLGPDAEVVGGYDPDGYEEMITVALPTSVGNRKLRGYVIRRYCSKLEKMTIFFNNKEKVEFLCPSLIASKVDDSRKSGTLIIDPVAEGVDDTTVSIDALLFAKPGSVSV